MMPPLESTASLVIFSIGVAVGVVVGWLAVRGHQRDARGLVDHALSGPLPARPINHAFTPVKKKPFKGLPGGW